MPALGEVWKHSHFYRDANTGEMLPKYLLILAVRPDGDLVYRLLTSQAHQRPHAPACDKDGVHPGYYLGTPMPMGVLCKPTWLDLREIEDFDARDFALLTKQNVLTLVHTFHKSILYPALECAAYAPDTTPRQSKYIMTARGTLNWP
ncbi:hypothetical protein [Janthinobacterium lividum]|uniref:hypothetical protein n=1 Tax=Janthinobacterium lividum TaxID=29581 RepID=UPI0011132F54|nr:hypothetical protein [Janthinobacterium lividum]